MAIDIIARGMIEDSNGDVSQLSEKVNNHTDNSDIHVELTPIRSGRFYKFLKFDIRPNINIESTIDNEPIEDTMPSAFNEISKALENLNIELTSTDAETLIDTAIEVTQANNIDINVVDYIVEKIELLKNYQEQNNVTVDVPLIKECLTFIKNFDFSPRIFTRFFKVATMSAPTEEDLRKPFLYR